MPGRAFWAGFVGICLLLAGLSIATKIRARAAAMLAGIMFTGFVTMIHVPNVVASPHTRLLWAVALRDLSFAGGAFALAARGNFLRIVTRIFVGVPLAVFAIHYMLHPTLAPGVPLAKQTPEWFPIRPFCGYLTAAALAVGGLCLLLAPGKLTRTSLALLGALAARS